MTTYRYMDDNNWNEHMLMIPQYLCRENMNARAQTCPKHYRKWKEMEEHQLRIKITPWSFTTSSLNGAMCSILHTVSVSWCTYLRVNSLISLITCAVPGINDMHVTCLLKAGPSMLARTMHMLDTNNACIQPNMHVIQKPLHVTCTVNTYYLTCMCLQEC